MRQRTRLRAASARSLALPLLTLLLAPALALPGHAAAAPAPRAAVARLGEATRAGLPHDPTSVLVRLAAGTAAAALPPAAQPIFGRWHRVPVEPGESATAALNRWLTTPGVEIVELNYVGRPASVPGAELLAQPLPAVTPDDPLFGVQWHFGAIEAPEAWERSRGHGVRIALVDTGVARGGVDLACRQLVHEYDAFTGAAGAQAAARDVHGHGTHVAGTLAQCTGNGVGVAGIAHAAVLMPIVASNPADPQDVPYDAMARGVAWAVEHGADVINLSVGIECAGLGWPDCSSAALNEALELAAAADVLVVAAAGNARQSTLAHPANHPLVLAVGALDQAGEAPYSNRGAALDLAAPGGNVNQDLDGDGRRDGVFQETLGSLCGSSKPYVFCGIAGTSMAAAHVSGAAALLRAHRPEATAAQVRQALEASAADLGAAGRDDVFGAGALRADAALSALDALLAGDAEPCVPSATTLCIDQLPGDRRFRVEVDFATVQGGGLAGEGRAIGLADKGIAAGGLFWFFDPTNPELLVKVLDGCTTNGKRWVFFSAGTNVGFTLTVADTVTGARRTYVNDDLHAAAPVQDTGAFACD